MFRSDRLAIAVLILTILILSAIMSFRGCRSHHVDAIPAPDTTAVDTITPDTFPPDTIKTPKNKKAKKPRRTKTATPAVPHSRPYLDEPVPAR